MRPKKLKKFKEVKVLKKFKEVKEEVKRSFFSKEIDFLY